MHGVRHKGMGNHDKVCYATKFGLTGKIPRADAVYVKECCITSVERLGVVTVDLYYCQGYVCLILSGSSFQLHAVQIQEIQSKLSLRLG